MNKISLASTRQSRGPIRTEFQGKTQQTKGSSCDCCINVEATWGVGARDGVERFGVFYFQQLADYTKDRKDRETNFLCAFCVRFLPVAHPAAAVAVAHAGCRPSSSDGCRVRTTRHAVARCVVVVRVNDAVARRLLCRYWRRLHRATLRHGDNNYDGE